MKNTEILHRSFALLHVKQAGILDILADTRKSFANKVIDIANGESQAARALAESLRQQELKHVDNSILRRNVFGVGVGATSGALLGESAGHFLSDKKKKKRNADIGALLGLLGGAGVGYLGMQATDKNKDLWARREILKQPASPPLFENLK